MTPVRLLCKERIWNQGKARATGRFPVAYCAKSGFGIKAKLGVDERGVAGDCAKSGFGIKAKPGLDVGR